MNPLVAARGVSRRFGAHEALRPTTLAVGSGEVVALVGPNGAGKSTLLAILAGGLEPTAGHVERGEGIRVGWMPQRPAHYGRLTARENLALFARLEREPDPDEAVERLLDSFELPRGRPPAAALSVGNRQRLNLALSLLGDPDVLLLDEPTAALDPRQRGRLSGTVQDLAARGGAVVFATQNVDEVHRAATRVALLVQGELTFDGDPATWEGSVEAGALVP